jgi:hypothetical protein
MGSLPSTRIATRGMRAARPGGGSVAGGRNRTRNPRRKLVGRYGLVLCHAYKLGLTEGQEVVGAKRGGKCMEYTLTTSAKAHGLLAPAQRGWRPTPHLRRRRGSKGQRPVFTAASCIWSVCRQSTLICRRDRALASTFYSLLIIHCLLFTVMAP